MVVYITCSMDKLDWILFPRRPSPFLPEISPSQSSCVGSLLPWAYLHSENIVGVKSSMAKNSVHGFNFRFLLRLR